MESPVAYCDVEEVQAVDSVQRHCVRVVLAEGSLLVQAGNAYVRDQWLHSILWKVNGYIYLQLSPIKLCADNFNITGIMYKI